jgi:hypothetical protein
MEWNYCFVEYGEAVSQPAIFLWWDSPHDNSPGIIPVAILNSSSGRQMWYRLSVSHFNNCHIKSFTVQLCVLMQYFSANLSGKLISVHYKFLCWKCLQKKKKDLPITMSG